MILITYLLLVILVALYGLYFSFAFAFELNAKEIKGAIIFPSLILSVIFVATLILLGFGAIYLGYGSLFTPFYITSLFFFLSYLVWAPISISRLDKLGFQKLHERYGLDKAAFRRITPWSKSRIIKDQMQP